MNNVNTKSINKIELAKLKKTILPLQNISKFHIVLCKVKCRMKVTQQSVAETIVYEIINRYMRYRPHIDIRHFYLYLKAEETLDAWGS